MRKSSQILIYINVQKALDAGIHFYLSANGVVLTDGDESGFLKPEFFERVVTARGEPVTDWTPSATTSDQKAGPSAADIMDSAPKSGTETSAQGSSTKPTIDEVQAQTEGLTLH